MLHDVLRGLIAESDGAGGLTMFAPFIAVFAIMYFLIIRPQQKQAKDQQDLLQNLKKGDQVVTTAGIIGRIHAIDDKVVTLEVASGVRIRVVKSFVQARQGAADEADEKKDAPADKEDKKEAK